MEAPLKNVPQAQVPSPALQRALEKKQIFSLVLFMAGIKPESFVPHEEELEEHRRTTRSPVIAHMLSLPAFQPEMTFTTVNEDGVRLTYGVLDAQGEEPLAVCYLSMARGGLIQVEYSGQLDRFRIGMEIDSDAITLKIVDFAKTLEVSGGLYEASEHTALTLVRGMAGIITGTPESTAAH